MSWIGAVTAILTLVFGLQRLVTWIGDWREQKARTAELVAVAKSQSASRHYPEAWASLKNAEQLDANNDMIRAAQEDLAMEWLRNAQVRQGEQTFTQLVEPLLPVLERGAIRARGARKADLLAHAGWADFLRLRDGAGDLAVDAQYRRAIEIDPNNPFAHGMWGYWILFSGGAVDVARRHFDQALSAGRERAYVRSMQISALLNRSAAPSIEELLGVANDMRRQGETIQKDAAGRVLWLTCYSDVPTAQSWARSGNRIPPAEEIVTLRWLFSGQPAQADRADLVRMCEARADAWAGDTVRALGTLRDLAANAEGDATRWKAQQAAARLQRTSN